MIIQSTHMQIFRLGIVAFAAALVFAPALAQESFPIQNPLIRPPTLASEPVAATSGTAAKGAERVPGRGAEPGSQSTDLQSKAAARLTQEDLNVQQQVLNAAVVPTPLQQLFANMYVAAHARGAIVLRRLQAMPQSTVVSGSENPGANGQGRANGVSTSVSTGGTASIGPSVLRFHENQVMNIVGYRLRARLDGLDVSVDWQNNSGHWVNVFFGAVESAPGYPRVPSSDQLQKMDKEAFKYLQPRLATQAGIGGGSPYQNNNSSYGNGNQAQPYNNNSNGNSFGTAAPIFSN